MKVRSRKRPLAQRQAAKQRKQNKQARQNVEPFFEQPSAVWKVVSFLGALVVIAGALISGAWNR